MAMEMLRRKRDREKETGTRMVVLLINDMSEGDTTTGARTDGTERTERRTNNGNERNPPTRPTTYRHTHHTTRTEPKLMSVIDALRT